MAEKRASREDLLRFSHLVGQMVDLWVEYNLKGFPNANIAETFTDFFARRLQAAYTPEVLAQLPHFSHFQTEPLTPETAVEKTLLEMSSEILNAVCNRLARERT